MFEMLVFFQLILSALIFNSPSPNLIALILIFLAFFQGLMCLILSSKWLGLSIIIIFIGGMMVVFLYVTSLSSNNKFILNKSYIFFNGLIFLSWVFFNTLFTPIPISMNYVAPSLYLLAHISSFLFLIAYLLMTLFIATKIAENFKGSLTEKF